MPIPVHRDTDARICGCSTIVVNQSTVFANNLLIAVFGDPDTCTSGELLATINPGTIFIENLELVVVGSDAIPDKCCKYDLHCNPKSATGSPNVFAF